MAYTASLTAFCANWMIELLISGAEDNFTGVRETLIAAELLEAAGPSRAAAMGTEHHSDRMEIREVRARDKGRIRVSA